MILRIIWYVSSLEQKGGGERFVLEGVEALKRAGNEVQLVCDRLTDAASFDGRYDLSVITALNSKEGGKSYLSIALSKALGIFKLSSLVRDFKPELVVCQSEFDAIKVHVLSKIYGFKYSVFVFGQMYQFSTDISKYSSVFRRYLNQIVQSRPGYKETVILPPPKLGLLTHLVNEFVSRLKFKALHSANEIYTLSNQVRWEVSLLYKREASVRRAAFWESYIDRDRLQQPKPVSGPARYVSVCRLVEKKRVDLIVAAFGKSKEGGVLTIMGTGPDAPRIQAMINHSPRKSNIRFLGSVSDEVLVRELVSADCFISMDVGDFDISVVEAMGKGLRVIVPKDFDTSPYGEQFTGISCVDRTSDALASAMDSLARSPYPQLQNLSALHELTWERLAEQIVKDV